MRTCWVRDVRPNNIGKDECWVERRSQGNVCASWRMHVKNNDSVVEYFYFIPMKVGFRARSSAPPSCQTLAVPKPPSPFPNGPQLQPHAQRTLSAKENVKNRLNKVCSAVATNPINITLEKILSKNETVFGDVSMLFVSWCCAERHLYFSVVTVQHPATDAPQEIYKAIHRILLTSCGDAFHFGDAFHCGNNIAQRNNKKIRFKQLS